MTATTPSFELNKEAIAARGRALGILGENNRQFRLALAERSGIDPAMIWRMFHNSKFTNSSLARLCHGLGMSPSEILVPRF